MFTQQIVESLDNFKWELSCVRIKKYPDTVSLNSYLVFNISPIIQGKSPVESKDQVRETMQKLNDYRKTGRAMIYVYFSWCRRTNIESIREIYLNKNQVAFFIDDIQTYDGSHNFSRSNYTYAFRSLPIGLLANQLIDGKTYPQNKFINAVESLNIDNFYNRIKFLIKVKY